MNPPPPRPPGGQTYPQATTARPGLIYQGAASSGITTQAATTSSGSVAKLTSYPPRYANAILSIIKPPIAAAVEDIESSTDRKRRYGELLDQLIPPLFSQSSSHDNSNEDEGRDDKKRKTDGDVASTTEETTVRSASCQSDDNNHPQSKEEYLTSLKQQLESYKHENERIRSTRMSVYNSFIELHECYETGLDGIARANDLRYVPDNVMMDRPGGASVK